MIGFDKDPHDSKPKCDAIRDMWAETGLDTDSVDVGIIVDWFDKRRGITEINHDTSIQQLIDKEDDIEIGLTGREAELQFVRLASAYNEMKKKLADMTKDRDNEAKMREHWFQCMQSRPSLGDKEELERKLNAMTKDRDYYISAMNAAMESKLAERKIANRAVEALKQLSENIGLTYLHDDDDVGECSVCHVTSYKEHDESCELRKAKELIAELEK